MKKHFKNLIGVLMSATFLFSSIIPTYAANSDNIQVINNSKSISENSIQELTNDIIENLDIKLVNEVSGETLPVETIVVINDNLRSGNSNEYNVSVLSNIKVKGDADSKNSEGITATANLEITWDDVFGPKNILKNVNGGISLTEGSIDYSLVTYGDASTASRRKTYRMGSNQKSFNLDPEMVALSPWAFYEIAFKDANFNLNVAVTGSVID